jgi:hypothetical protein
MVQRGEWCQPITLTKKKICFFFFFFGATAQTRARAACFIRFLDYTQGHNRCR